MIVGKSKPVTCQIYMFDTMRFLKRKKGIRHKIFSSFPYLTSLDMSRTKISLVKGLELLYPFRYKNMTKINLSHMKTPKSNSISVFKNDRGKIQTCYLPNLYIRYNEVSQKKKGNSPQNQQCYYHADKVGLHKLFLDIASYLNQL
jgi:hypothetical protein